MMLIDPKMHENPQKRVEQYPQSAEIGEKPKKCNFSKIAQQNWLQFLSDPGKPGVRSLGPDVCLSVRHKQTTRRL